VSNIPNLVQTESFGLGKNRFCFLSWADGF